MTALILLAAGLSERFGTENKLLADLGGKPMIQHVIEAAEDIHYMHRIAVVSQDDEVKNICKSNGYDVILNEKSKLGQGRSIVLGVRQAMDLGAKSVCIILGDMPLVPTSHLYNLLAVRPKSDIVFSAHKGDRMPPAIFSGEALNKLLSLKDGQGARHVFSGADCFEIALPKRQAQDIDTQDELRKLKLV